MGWPTGGVKTGLALLLALLLVVPALAGTVTVVNPTAVPLGDVYTLVNAQTINATATYTSSAVDLNRGLYFGVWYLCTSAAGAPDIKIEWLESASTTDSDFVVTNTITPSVVAETPQLATFNPPPMRYGEIKLTGNAANQTDTVCTVKVFLQPTRLP